MDNKNKIIKYLHEQDLYRIFREYNYNQIPHKYITDINTYNETIHTESYKTNFITNLFYKETIDDEIFQALTKMREFSINSNAAYINFIFQRSKYSKTSDILAKILLNIKGIEGANSKYVEKLFKEKNFYRDENSEGFFLLKEPDDNNVIDIDFGKYAFNSLNPLALNYIYLELKEHKKNYQKFVYDELSLDKFSLIIEHYKKDHNNWKNKEDVKIKDISNFFYNIDFILFFAKNNNMNKEQIEILDFILKDKKLIKKLEKNAEKKDIYTKKIHEQKNSKNVLIQAVLKENKQFLNILLNSDYILNEYEKSFLNANPIKDNLDIGIDIDITTSNINLLKQQIINTINKDKINQDFIYNLSEKDIQNLIKDYQNFTHTPFLMTNLKSPQLKQQNLALFENKQIHLLDVLIINKPFFLPALQAKGITNLHPLVTNLVFKEILFYNNSYNFSTDTLKDTFKLINSYFDGHSEASKIELYNILMNSPLNSSKNINGIFDSIIADKVESYQYDKNQKIFLSTISLAILNKLDNEDKEKFYKNNLEQHFIDLISQYIEEIHKNRIDYILNNNQNPIDEIYFESMFNEIIKTKLKSEKIFDILESIKGNFLLDKEIFNYIKVNIEKNILKSSNLKDDNQIQKINKRL